MINYEQHIEELIKAITNISFEFDFEEVIKEMKLEEVPKSELEELGNEKVQEKFNNGYYKIQLPNGNLIDVNSISKFANENNIKTPSILINPDFKYVKWVIKKDFLSPQRKNKIREKLKNNSLIELSKLEESLLNEHVKNKEPDGYIGDLPVVTSDLINPGKFIIKSSCSRESAIKIINEEIKELKIDVQKYIMKRMRKTWKHIFIYLIFIVFITSLWLLNNQYRVLSVKWSNIISLILFVIPLTVIRIINHSIFDIIFNRKKAKRKFEEDFYNIT